MAPKEAVELLWMGVCGLGFRAKGGILWFMAIGFTSQVCLENFVCSDVGRLYGEDPLHEPSAGRSWLRPGGSF